MLREVDDMDGELEAVGDQWRLRFTRELAHEPAKVWRAITEADHFGPGFRSASSVTGRSGAPLRFEGESGSFEGRVLRFEPETILEFLWGTDVIRLEVAPGQDGQQHHADPCWTPSPRSGRRLATPPGGIPASIFSPTTWRPSRRRGSPARAGRKSTPATWTSSAPRPQPWVRPLDLADVRDTCRDFRFSKIALRVDQPLRNRRRLSHGVSYPGRRGRRVTSAVRASLGASGPLGRNPWRGAGGAVGGPDDGRGGRRSDPRCGTVVGPTAFPPARHDLRTCRRGVRQHRLPFSGKRWSTRRRLRPTGWHPVTILGCRSDRCGRCWRWSTSTWTIHFWSRWPPISGPPRPPPRVRGGGPGATPVPARCGRMRPGRKVASTPLRRFATVRHLADLFDHYGVHRPEMVQAWAGHLGAGDPGSGPAGQRPLAGRVVAPAPPANRRREPGGADLGRGTAPLRAPGPRRPAAPPVVVRSDPTAGEPPDGSTGHRHLAGCSPLPVASLRCPVGQGVAGRPPPAGGDATSR